MAFQYKTLIGLASTALFVVAFQNCAPQKFATMTSASEKTLANNGTGSDSSSDPSSDDHSGGKQGGNCDTDGGSSNNSGWTWSNGGKKSDDGKKSDESKKSSDDATSSVKRAANCKALREKFVSMQIKPAAMSDIRVSGQTVSGPFYVSGVDSIISTGQSDVYLVGSDANAMAKEIRSSGQGHVVLCGVYAGNVRVTGQGNVDVIGASVLGDVDPAGQGQVNIFDQDGNPL